MEKITFGKDALPGYICGEKKAPGLLVIQGMTVKYVQIYIALTCFLSSDPSMVVGLL